MELPMPKPWLYAKSKTDEEWRAEQGGKMESSIEVVVYFWIVMKQRVVSKKDRTKNRSSSKFSHFLRSRFGDILG